MKILFTGASSFTGMWFVEELCRAGHEVVATFRRTDADAYDEQPRRRRVQRLMNLCQPIFGCSFGDETFIETIRQRGPWDLLCHHGADVTNYKSPAFDVTAALASNTRNIVDVLSAVQSSGCGRLLLTGSVFEGGEGAGSDGLPHFSPYGFSKALTAEVFSYYAQQAQTKLGKFVIPNPFGPCEEPRFTAYLMRTWFAGGLAAVRTPDYVRDNIHVSLLAAAYADFAGRLADEPGFEKFSPSGYVETQGCFAERFAEQMRKRIDLSCELKLQRQTEFTEPLNRVNTDAVDAAKLGWDETAAWDAVAEYYSRQFAGNVAS